MRSLIGFLTVLAALTGAGAQAKGFLTHGIYEGKGASGKLYRIGFDTVIIDSTTTVVTECNFDYQCTHTAKVDLHDGRHKVTALDFYASAETYGPTGWGSTFGKIGPRRVYYSLFTVKIRTPEDEVMTLVAPGETVELKRIATTETR